MPLLFVIRFPYAFAAIRKQLREGKIRAISAIWIVFLLLISDVDLAVPNKLVDVATNLLGSGHKQLLETRSASF